MLGRERSGGKISWMKNPEPKRGVFTQDCIFGAECFAMAIELGYKTAIALMPLEYKFFQGTRDTEAFLAWENKFDGVEKGNVPYGFVTYEPRRSALQNAAVSAFNIARQGKPACCARVDMRYERETGKIYIIAIGNPPIVSYPPGNSLGDDLVVEKTLPGGHLLRFFAFAVVPSPTTWRGFTLGRAAHNFCCGSQNLRLLYRENGRHVRLIALGQPWYKAIASQLEKFSFAVKTVLDLGCGTGLFGRLLNESGRPARITGVDISKGMVECAAISKFYQTPLIIEEIQTRSRTTSTTTMSSASARCISYTLWSSTPC